MIKINLIPVKRKKKAKPVPPFLVAAVLLLLLSGIGVLFAYKSIAATVTDLENQKKANAEKLKELEKKVAEVKNFENLNKQVAQRKNIIEQLTKNQSIPVRILDEMSNSLTDGIWFTSMNITGKRITISGIGFSNTDIVTFVQSLKASDFFDDVNLQGTSRKLQGTVETYTFNLTVEVMI
jgi:type IV pilus assembly protein PilN